VTAALAMRLKLRRLMREHQVLSEPHVVPLAEPSDGPLVLEGVAAATGCIDLDRCALRPFAFGFPLWFRRDLLPPLLYRHDPEQVAGRIENLSYDDHGALLIRATVTHAIAKRCGAFSIGAKVLAYELRDADSDRFYAIISSAELMEVSLTSTPAQPEALVKHRYRVSPAAEFYSLAGERVARLIEVARLLRLEQHS
jgi:hypothetical protein